MRLLEHTVGLATATAMNGSRETNALFCKVWKDKIPPNIFSGHLICLRKSRHVLLPTIFI
jgi:hypothetical protein